MIRYIVTATLSNKDVIEEYTAWLKNGHIQAVVEEGGAVCGEFSILQDTAEVKVQSAYLFSSMAALEGYFNGVASRLRQEGISMFVETNKVLKFERFIGDVMFEYKSVEYDNRLA
jgi:hypothetical protein